MKSRRRPRHTGLAQFLSCRGQHRSHPNQYSWPRSNAIVTVESLANLTTGTSPGASLPSNGSSPAAKINSIANLLNTCTSATSASGCTALFSATTPGGGTAPSNTLDAALNLVRNPGRNVAALYTQSTASTAFTTALTVAPSRRLDDVPQLHRRRDESAHRRRRSTP